VRAKGWAVVEQAKAIVNSKPPDEQMLGRRAWRLDKSPSGVIDTLARLMFWGIIRKLKKSLKDAI